VLFEELRKLMYDVIRTGRKYMPDHSNQETCLEPLPCPFEGPGASRYPPEGMPTWGQRKNFHKEKLAAARDEWMKWQADNLGKES
jgi:hypothetical protein